MLVTPTPQYFPGYQPTKHKKDTPMHERTSLADELHAAMLDAPDCCAQCGKPLADNAQYLCDSCTEAVYCADSDICEPWDVRFDPFYQPADRFGISVFGVLLLATVLAGFIASVGMREVQAQDTTLRAPHAINGRIYEWPAIGPLEYSRSCRIVRFFEDGSARAWCAEDGAFYSFDPDAPTGQGYGWSPVQTTR